MSRSRDCTFLPDEVAALGIERGERVVEHHSVNALREHRVYTARHRHAQLLAARELTASGARLRELPLLRHHVSQVVHVFGELGARQRYLQRVFVNLWCAECDVVLDGTVDEARGLLGVRDSTTTRVQSTRAHGALGRPDQRLKQCGLAGRDVPLRFQRHVTA
jgi:hypothetical protein